MRSAGDDRRLNWPVAAYPIPPGLELAATTVSRRELGRTDDPHWFDPDDAGDKLAAFVIGFCLASLTVRRRQLPSERADAFQSVRPRRAAHSLSSASRRAC